MSAFEIVAVAVIAPITAATAFVFTVGAAFDAVLRRESKRREKARLITARIDEVHAAAERAERARREGRV